MPVITLRYGKLWLIHSIGILSGCVPALANFDCTEYVLGNSSFKVYVSVASSKLFDTFGPRFDMTAMISGIECDGHSFVSPVGLADEFGQSGLGVLGYDTAENGATFAKIGVGLLTKMDSEKYLFKARYPVVKLFPVNVTETSATLIVVEQAGDAPGGYRYQYSKKYQVDTVDKSLKIEYSMQNTGAQALTINHYNHHWFKIDQTSIGPAYNFISGFPVSKAENGQYTQSSKGIAPADVRQHNNYHYEEREIPAAENWFSLSLKQQDQEIIIYSSGNYPASAFALYGAERGFCPEIFFVRQIAPGATETWSRCYSFRTKNVKDSFAH